jgi:hypothetical protein
MHRATTNLVFGILALLLACGCTKVPDVTYPELTTTAPEDMQIFPDHKQYLIMVLATTNTVGVLAPASYLTDSRGRRYRLEFDTVKVSKTQPIYNWYHIRAYSLSPSATQLSFGSSGSYSMSLSYTNAGSAEHLAINRRFVIRWHYMNPIVWIQWLLHGD